MVSRLKNGGQKVKDKCVCVCKRERKAKRERESLVVNDPVHPVRPDFETTQLGFQCLKEYVAVSLPQCQIPNIRSPIGLQKHKQ